MRSDRWSDGFVIAAYGESERLLRAAEPPTAVAVTYRMIVG